MWKYYDSSASSSSSFFEEEDETPYACFGGEDDLLVSDGQLEISQSDKEDIVPYAYDTYLEEISLFREQGVFSLLRSTRQEMSRFYPLTEELWLEWLKDELSRGTGGARREGLYKLFERAVQDYICPHVWLEYAQFSIGEIGQEGGIEKVRSIMERALIAVGLHVTKGSAIWQVYREFENALLATMKPPPDCDPTPEQQQNVKVQLERIHALYRRELSIPLIDMEATLLEYEHWTEEPIPETVLQNYMKAVQQLRKYKPYEKALMTADAPRLAEYQAYVDFELKIGDPARIQQIYERALVENCLVSDLWVQYIQYLDRQLKAQEVVLSTCRRAVRNCPWTVKLWSLYLLAMERHHVEHPKILESFEKALKVGFFVANDYMEIWQTYLDYLRRRVDFTQDSSKELEELRSAFARAVKYLKEDVPQEFLANEDPSCIVLQVWARIEAHLCNNMQKARELWDSIMASGNTKYANMWLEYYNLERAHGDLLHRRKTLYRAVQQTQDYPEHICEVLLTLERIEGTLEDWDVAVRKTETRLTRVKEKKAKEAEKEAALAKQKEERKAEQRKEARVKQRAKKRGEQRGAEQRAEAGVTQRAATGAQRLPAGVKRKAGGDAWAEEAEEGEVATKRPKGSSGEMSGEEEGGAVATSPLPPKVDLRPEWKDAPKVLHDSRKEGLTVFVSNLSYQMADPETKLRDLFASCGEVAEVRPIFSNKGMFRGYCYVEFKEPGSAQQAFGLDRSVVDGRPMFVSPYVDKSKNPDFKMFKYSTALEKHKLFISGLPFSCTKKELEEVCQAYGNVKDIRLVTNRSGKPKGLAYVEFENETQASQAVLKMDGLAIMDHVIKVALSNPPARRGPEGPEALGKPSQTQDPGHQAALGARRKGRTQLLMVPRVLQRPSNPAAEAKNGEVQKPPSTPSTSAEEPRMSSSWDSIELLRQKPTIHSLVCGDDD